MDKLTLAQCRTYLKKLQEVSICNICHGPLRSPGIFVCNSYGHAVCSACKTRTTYCAMCNSNYCSTKPTTLCQMVDALPRFCRFNYGCNQLLQDNDDHESWCKYRPVKCPYCPSMGEVECQQFLKHLYDAHSIKPHHALDVDVHRKNVLFDGKFQLNCGTIKLFDGHIFNVHYVYYPQQKGLKVHIVFWPTRSVDKTDFIFRLELRSTDYKVWITLCKEFKIAANVKSDVFDIAEPLLKSFNLKYVDFKTVISAVGSDQRSEDDSSSLSSSTSAKKAKKK